MGAARQASAYHDAERGYGGGVYKRGRGVWTVGAGRNESDRSRGEVSSYTLPSFTLVSLYPWTSTSQGRLSLHNEADMCRRAKKGLWALKSFEHPADYKKRVKAGEEAMIGVEEVSTGGRTGMWGFINRILGR